MAEGDEEMELMTAHFWVDDRLYEVDYFRPVGQNGGTKFIKVYKSERRCRCDDREAREQRRQEVRGAECA